MPNWKQITYIVLIIFLVILGFFYINGSDESVRKASSIYFFAVLSVLVLFDIGLRIKLLK